LCFLFCRWNIPTVSRDGTARLWQTDGTPVAAFRAASDPPEPLTALSWCPSGKQLSTGSQWGIVRRWDSRGSLLASAQLHSGAVMSIAYAPDANDMSSPLLSISVDGSAAVWDESGVERVEGFGESLISCCWRDASYFAVCGRDQAVSVCRRGSGRPLRVLRGHTSDVNVVAFDRPGGDILASCSDDCTAALWAPFDESKEGPRAVLRGHELQIYGLGWSPRGDGLATASYDKTVRLWDAGTGQERYVLRGHTDGVFCACYSPSGRYVASCGGDGAVIVWGVGTGQELRRMQGASSVNSIVWGKDDTTLCLGCADGKAGIIDLRV